MTIERTLDFAVPRNRIYTYLADDTHLRDWRDGLVQSERLSPAGPLDGATYRETVDTPMGRQTATVRLTTREPEFVGFEVLDGPVRPTGSMTLTDTGAGTRLVYRMDLKPMLGVPSPLDAAAAAYLTAGIERSLAKLKGLLEP